MKFYETHYDDYIQSVQQCNFHPGLTFPSILTNAIFYGPRGSGKYSQMLTYLRSSSPSQLKYESKITVTTDKQVYKYRISDIHYEVDMGLLGCNSKTVWHEIYQQIVDVVSMKVGGTEEGGKKGKKHGVIVCKNFHLIHNELLDIFYSYMQQYRDETSNIRLYFILLTEHVSFLTNNIRNVCLVIPIPRPEKQVLTEGLGILKESFSREKMTEKLDSIQTSDLMNLKELYSFPLVDKLEDLPKDNFNAVCDELILAMEQHETLQMATFRDNLYDILIYGLDAAECYSIYFLILFVVNNLM